MDFNKYHNCLRVQITNDTRSDERIKEIADHCLKNGFDNVMLLINQEEFNLGHISIDLAKPWVEILKKAKKYFEEKGLSVSLNNWVTLGHADRGRGLHEGQDFQFMVDMHGREATHCVCPLSENWQNYYIEFITYLVIELKPDTFWIEDDFRLHNHAPLTDIGCYCPLHMQYYNSKLGTNYTREEFVEKISQKGEKNAEREVWLNASRDAIINLADKIAKAVKKANSDTQLGLMSSFPDVHCLEGRNWDGLLSALSQGGEKIHRIHLTYFEPSGKINIYELNANAMPIRAMAGDEVVIMPEMEHGSATLYEKTPRYFAFSLEAALPLILSGMTHSIYDFIGNGVRDCLGYGAEVKKLNPYMQAVMSLNIPFSSLRGCIIPIDEEAAYKKSITTGNYKELAPTEQHIGAYLSGMGINYKYSTQKEFNGETIFLNGSNIQYFSDYQVKKLYRDNFVISDGGAVLNLKERGLLRLIGAKDAELMICDTGAYSYEEICDKDAVIYGIKGLRASGRMSSGDAVKVSYNQKVDVCTELFDHNMIKAASSFVKGKNFAVFPFFIDKKRYSMFCDLRRHFFSETLSEQKTPFILTQSPGISPYLYKTKNGFVLILENANVDIYPNIELKIKNINFSKAYYIDRNGKTKKLSFKLKGDTLTLRKKLDYLTSETIILK